MTDNRLEELLKKQAIVDIVYRYARAIDRLDEALLRSCFHPGRPAIQRWIISLVVATLISSNVEIMFGVLSVELG